MNNRERVRDMNVEDNTQVDRRGLIRGGAAAAMVLALPACSTIPGLSFTDAIRRLLVLSSERAFVRLTAPDGFWDQQIGRLGLNQVLGTRGDILSGILTSALVKDRLEDAFADIAIKGAERAAPLVAETVRTIGIANAAALVRGGPSAATQFLRGEMGDTLIEAMVPELGQAIRIASDPVVGELINSVAGTNVSGIASRLSDNVNDAIWQELGVEEGAIRANPRATNDPLLIGVFGLGSQL